VGEEREVEHNGGEEREGKEMDGCPLTYSSQQNCSNVFNLWKDALILYEIHSGKLREN
jgi:hypothetical protein